MTQLGHSWQATKTDRGEAGFFKQAKRGITVQAIVAPKWGRDVYGPAFFAGVAAFVMAFCIAGLLLWEWADIMFAAVGAFGMALLLMLFLQTIFYNLGHFVYRFYQVPDEEPEDTRPVFVADETAAEEQLLPLMICDEHCLVTQFGRKKYELEEIFLNIVEGGENVS